MAKNLLYTWGTELGLSFVLVDLVLIAHSGDLELRNRVTSGGNPLWDEPNHVP